MIVQHVNIFFYVSLFSCHRLTLISIFVFFYIKHVYALGYIERHDLFLLCHFFKSESLSQKHVSSNSKGSIDSYYYSVYSFHMDLLAS